jgi:hypothetical protein
VALDDSRGSGGGGGSSSSGGVALDADQVLLLEKLVGLMLRRGSTHCTVSPLLFWGSKACCVSHVPPPAAAAAAVGVVGEKGGQDCMLSRWCWSGSLLWGCCSGAWGQLGTVCSWPLLY